MMTKHLGSSAPCLFKLVSRESSKLFPFDISDPKERMNLPFSCPQPISLKVTFLSVPFSLLRLKKVYGSKVYDSPTYSADSGIATIGRGA